MESPKSIKPLTSLRGIAAFWVYLFHCRFLFSPEHPVVNKFIESGYYRVDIFFIMSGFFIAYIHSKEFLNFSEAKKNFSKFLILRFLRIYPLHLMVLIVFFVAQQIPSFGSTKDDTFENFILNLFMVHSWGASNVLSWNKVAWSISVEWFLYLVFPLIFAGIFSKVKKPILNLAVIFFIVAAASIYNEYTGRNIFRTATSYNTLIRGILDFIIGISLYNMFVSGFLKKLPWDIISVVVITSFFLIAWLRSHNEDINEIYMIGLASVLIYSLANIKGFAHYIFSNRILLYLGKISYSFFIIHWFFIIFMQKNQDIIFDELSYFTWQFLLATLILIGLASLVFRFVEVPTRNFSRKILALPEEKLKIAAKLVYAFLAAGIVAVIFFAIKAVLQPTKEDFEKNAAAGNAVSQYNLGVIYYNEKNFADAASWFEKSAKKGYIPSCYSLGNLYSNGQGVKRDQKIAALYYLKAASAGFTPAQYTLGYILSKGGEYLNKDNEMAYFWLLLASKDNNSRTELLEEVESQLTKKQIDKIKKKAEEYESRNKH